MDMIDLLACSNAMEGGTWGGHTAAFSVGDLGLPGLGVAAILLFALRRRNLRLRDRVGFLVVGALVGMAVAALLGAEFQMSNLGMGTGAALAVLVAWLWVRDRITRAKTRGDEAAKAFARSKLERPAPAKRPLLR